MANVRSLGFWLGVGAVGLAGFGAVKLITQKKQSVHREKEKIAEPEPDRPLEMVPCGSCNQTIKEYEYFCPHCGVARDK